MATLGERIKELRTEKKLSQEELGKILGIGKAAIWKYENECVHNIKRESIKTLSSYFGVSPNYLLGYSDERNEQLLKLSDLDEAEKRRAAQFLSLTKEEKEKILDYMEYVLSQREK